MITTTALVRDLAAVWNAASKSGFGPADSSDCIGIFRANAAASYSLKERVGPGLGITLRELFWPFLFCVENQAPVNDSVTDAKVQRSLAEKIDPLIERMTMPQPQDRIQSMDIVVTELRRIRDEMRMGAFDRFSRLLRKLRWRGSLAK